MKKGKIILSAAAIVVTATSILAFKAHRTAGAKHIYGYTGKGSGATHCKVSASCFTTNSGLSAGNGGIVAVCHTSGGVKTLTKGTGSALWTAKTTNAAHCAGSNINYTKTN